MNFRTRTRLDCDSLPGRLLSPSLPISLPPSLPLSDSLPPYPSLFIPEIVTPSFDTFPSLFIPVPLFICFTPLSLTRSVTTSSARHVQRWRSPWSWTTIRGAACRASEKAEEDESNGRFIKKLGFFMPVFVFQASKDRVRRR